MHGLLLQQGTTLDAGLATAGVHWAVGSGRMAQFLVDIDKAGIDDTPIDGPWETAVPKAMKVFAKALAKLTPAQRIITRDDTIVDGQLDNPQTDTWYDHITPNAFLQGGGGMDVLSQWFNLTPCCFTRAEDGGRGGALLRATHKPA